MTMEDIQKHTEAVHKYYEIAVEYLMKYGFQVLGGLIILAIGVAVANWVNRLVFGLFQKKKMDVTLSKFLANAVRVVILVFVAIAAFEKFGITVSPLIASISALIFGASFAIQAPLSNYAAGLSIILTRPFAVGHTISVKGVSGIVEDVKLACTVLIDEDGQRITIPNKEIVGEILVDSKEYKIVEVQIGISYDSKPETAISVMRGVLEKNPRVAKTPPPQIGIHSFGDSSINIGLRYWVLMREYYRALYEANLEIYNALQAARIVIPYPRRDLHIISGSIPDSVPTAPKVHS